MEIIIWSNGENKETVSAAAARLASRLRRASSRWRAETIIAFAIPARTISA